MAKWWDGSPVTNVMVRCEGPRDFVWVNTDENGRAECEVLTTSAFRVQLGWLNWEDSLTPTKGVEAASIDAGTEPALVKFTVAKENDMRSTKKPVLQPGKIDH